MHRETFEELQRTLRAPQPQSMNKSQEPPSLKPMVCPAGHPKPNLPQSPQPACEGRNCHNPDFPKAETEAQASPTAALTFGAKSADF